MDIKSIIDQSTKRIVYYADTAISVQVGVPIPPKQTGPKRGSKRGSKYAGLQALQRGDHFTVENRKIADRLVAGGRALNIKFITRIMPDGKIGLWVI